jgi:acyl carrier protein
MKDEILEILKKVLNLKELNIDVDLNFSEIGFDSLSTVELVIALEDKYGVKIDEMEGLRLTTINEVIKFLEEKKALSA